MNSTLAELNERYGGWLSPTEEAELFSVAVHESAHGMVAAHFGLDPDELVVSANAGVCVHRRGSMLENAAVSFAGVMGECLLNAAHKSRTLPKTPLTKSTLCKWVDELPVWELSREDREGIEKCSDRYLAASVAFGVLHSGLEALEYLARRLAERSRDRFFQSTVQPGHARDEADLAAFVEQMNRTDAVAELDERLARAASEAAEILANLPPVPLPKEFNIETFQAATGANNDDIRAFCVFKLLRERNAIGLGPPTESRIETEFKFFRAVDTRDTWIYHAREFCAWRDKKKQQKELK